MAPPQETQPKMFREYRYQHVSFVAAIQSFMDRQVIEYQAAHKNSRPEDENIIIQNLLDQEYLQESVSYFIFPIVNSAVQTYLSRINAPESARVYCPSIVFLDDIAADNFFEKKSDRFVDNTYGEGVVCIHTSRFIQALQDAQDEQEIDSIWEQISKTYLIHLSEINRAYRLSPKSKHVFHLGTSIYINYDRSDESTEEFDDSVEDLYKRNCFQILGVSIPLYETTETADTSEPQDETTETEDTSEPQDKVSAESIFTRINPEIDETIELEDNLDRTYDPLVRRVFLWLEHTRQINDEEFQMSVTNSREVDNFPDIDVIRNYQIMPAIAVTSTVVEKADQLHVCIDHKNTAFMPYTLTETVPDTEEAYTQRILDYVFFLQPSCLYAFWDYQTAMVDLSDMYREYYPDKNDTEADFVFRKIQKLEHIWNELDTRVRESQLKILYEVLERKVKNKIKTLTQR